MITGTKPCERCSTTFYVRHGNQKYCSKSCYDRAHHRKYYKKMTFKTIACLHCNIEFIPTDGKQVYCSRRCSDTAYRSRQRLLNLFDYTLRERARKIFNKARIASKSCEICSSHYSTEAHHQDYNRPLKVNWLCRRCHMKVHFVVRELARIAV